MVEHSAVNRRAIGSSPICPAIMRKYPRGWRGSPAKGVGHQKMMRGFESLLPRQQYAEMAEWSIAPALKTGGGKPSVGSNPTLRAKEKKYR